VTNPFGEVAPAVSRDREAACARVTYLVPDGEVSADAREALLDTVAGGGTERLAVEGGRATTAPVEV
jgi:hypothetical protein